MGSRDSRSDRPLRDRLTPEQYHVTQEQGTEPPFSGKFYANKENGSYLCLCCGNELFSSATKYDSGTGWPSFWEPRSDSSVSTATDSTHGMVREEVCCAKCGAHLGHVFTDGPEPTGLRYCINSAALDFEKDDKAE